VPTLLVKAHVVDLQWSKREGKRQMIGDPPPWISIVLVAKKLISSQEPRWMQRTMYDPPQEAAGQDSLNVAKEFDPTGSQQECREQK